MINSRAKGQAGEREAAAALAAIGIEAKRTGQTCGLASPDVQTALPGLWIECKRVERLNVGDAMDQATFDGGITLAPVVLHRTNRRPWLVTLRLADLPRIAEIVSRNTRMVTP